MSDYVLGQEDLDFLATLKKHKSRKSDGAIQVNYGHFPKWLLVSSIRVMGPPTYGKIIDNGNGKYKHLYLEFGTDAKCIIIEVEP